jgi:hypothetical protein
MVGLGTYKVWMQLMNAPRPFNPFVGAHSVNRATHSALQSAPGSRTITSASIFRSGRRLAYHISCFTFLSPFFVDLHVCANCFEHAPNKCIRYTTYHVPNKRVQYMIPAARIRGEGWRAGTVRGGTVRTRSTTGVHKRENNGALWTAHSTGQRVS